MRRALSLAEQVVTAFLAGFVGAWIVTGALDANSAKVALAAGLVAAGKSFMAFGVGDPQSATFTGPTPAPAPPAPPPSASP